MRETIIYGGAFNPPTVAHTMIAQSLLDHAATCESDVWIMPSGERADKTIAEPVARRLAYVAAMLESCDTHGVTVRIETSELETTRQTETYETVHRLESAYPDREFVWVFGADSVLDMKSWGHGERLYRELNMLLIARHGFTLTVLPPHATQLEVVAPDVSSTEVRRRVAAGQDVSDCVTGRVRDLIVPVAR